jgi:DNA transformation protein and related proteins
MKNQYRDYVLDLLQPHGPITARAMFGGHGIYYGSAIIGLIVDSELYFKVDDETRSDYEAYRSVPFIYEGKSKTVTMPYMKVPESILEDNEELPLWIEKALQVSLKKPTATKRSTKPTQKKSASSQL